MNNDILSGEIMFSLECIKEADIVIAIDGSYDNASIKNTVEALALGAAKYFPEQKCILIKENGEENEDNFYLSIDPYKKRELNFIEHPFVPVHRIILEGEKKRKDFVRKVFTVADQLNCEACILLRDDLQFISPETVEALLKPVINSEYDFISPFYNCCNQDFTLRNNIIYPLIKTLYNAEIFYPSGCDFGISIDLIRTFLEKDIWSNDLNIDIWMIITAINDGFEIGQTFLGPKIFEANNSIKERKDSFYETVQTLFTLMGQYKDFWNHYSDDKTKRIPIFSFPSGIFPPSFDLNLEEIGKEARELYDKYLGDIKETLKDETFDKLVEVFTLAKNDYISINDELWVNIVNDYACYFSLYETDYKFFNSMTPLYLFRIVSFIKKTGPLKEEFKEKIEELCNKFEEIRKELVKTQLNNI